MKTLFEKYAKRLDALTRRERIMVFAAVAALILTFFYVLGIGPATERSRLLNRHIAEQKNMIIAADAQRNELERTLKQDPDVAVRERIAEKRKQIGELDTQLAGLQRTLVPPQSMGVVLEQLVGNERRVRIVELRNLPATPLVQKDGETTAPATGPPAQQAGGQPAVPGRHVYKHGVHVVIEGSYLDLLNYVARLEKQPWQVYWGKTVMSSDYPTARVELTLYTLSLDQAWLVV
jgi:MSHA biogenesis protein MshJ